MPKCKKYLGKDTKDGYTILDSIPTIKPYEEITDISEFTLGTVNICSSGNANGGSTAPTVVPVKPTVVPTATKEAVVTESQWQRKSQRLQ